MLWSLALQVDDRGPLIHGCVAQARRVRPGRHAVQRPSRNGLLRIYSNVTDKDHGPALVTDHWLKWESLSGDWQQTGHVGVAAEVYVDAAVNWNTTLLFQYGDNAYVARITENDYGRGGRNEFTVGGRGRYGADSINNW